MPTVMLVMVETFCSSLTAGNIAVNNVKAAFVQIYATMKQKKRNPSGICQSEDSSEEHHTRDADPQIGLSATTLIGCRPEHRRCERDNDVRDSQRPPELSARPLQHDLDEGTKIGRDDDQ